MGEETEKTQAEPKLVRRRENRKSTLKIGRTIGEVREQLETKSERTIARKKDKFKKVLRIVLTIVGFVTLIAILIGIYLSFRSAEAQLAEINDSSVGPSKPSIEVVDENSNQLNNLTNRMLEYINQYASNLKTYGLMANKAVVSSKSIREVDFYLDGYTGYIKTTIDRGAGVTAEDTDRMIRYLTENGITDFTYVDIRIDRKAYWK